VQDQPALGITKKAGPGANIEVTWDASVIWMKWAQGEGERLEGSVCGATFRPGYHHPVCALVGAPSASGSQEMRTMILSISLIPVATTTGEHPGGEDGWHKRCSWTDDNRAMHSLNDSDRPCLRQVDEKRQDSYSELQPRAIHPTGVNHTHSLAAHPAAKKVFGLYW
jgi:hypothetical protein